MNKLVSLISGIVFGIGLVISEMINPEKVLGFLICLETGILLWLLL